MTHRIATSRPHRISAYIEARVRIAYARGEGGYKRLARRFGIGKTSVSRIVGASQRWRK